MKSTLLKALSLPRKALSLPGTQISDAKISRALRISLWDGVFCSGMIAMTETFAVAGAVYLKAPSVAIGILAGIPLLLGSLGQLVFATYSQPSAGRKPMVLIGTASQSILLIMLATSGWLPAPLRPWAFVAFFALQGFFGNVITGVWMAWMAELVDPAIRGRFFANRNRIINLFQFCCGLVAGILAFRQTTETASWTFFALVFIAAGVFRLLSTAMLSFQYAPAPAVRIPEHDALEKPQSFHNFLLFCIALALMQGAVMFASPFFNVWFIRDLHFTYFKVAATTASMVFGSVIALPVWGKLSDRIGHRRVLLITGLMISIVPVGFLLSENPLFIIAYNCYAGICWSGYNLSNFNFLLALSGPYKPERQISLAVALSGISVFVFGLAGGILAPLLPVIFHWQLQSLFLVSGLMRLTIFLVFFLNIRDTGAVVPRMAADLFSYARNLLGKT